jgi:hypothetical protein
MRPGYSSEFLTTTETFKDACYGIPVDLIATWCAVDIQTARHWKSGTRAPGKGAFKLFNLHLNGQILPADWEGFSFRDGQMWDPYGKPFTRSQLRLYGIAWQIFREWTRDDAERRATLDDLCGIKRLPPMAAGAEERAARALTAVAQTRSADVPRRLPETVRRANLDAHDPASRRTPASDVRRRANRSI